MELNGKARERIREAVRDALSRDDMSEADIADMAADMTMDALSADLDVNLAAEFLPAKGRDELPALKVAGALVFGYVSNGVLRVSVDLDTVSDSDYWPAGQDATPLEITVQGTTVYDGDERELRTCIQCGTSNDAVQWPPCPNCGYDSRASADDARIIRKYSDSEPELWPEHQ